MIPHIEKNPSSHYTRPKTSSVLGVVFSPVTMEEAIEAFERLIAARRAAFAFNVNVDICMKIQRDSELRAIFSAADLVLVDGTPMMWAARFLGCPLPGRVSGSDFVPAFCRTAADKGYRIFLLGGRNGIAEGAKEWLERHNPDLRIVGTYSPPFGFERDVRENARIIDIIREASPDVLFVAFGVPKEEKWVFRTRHVLRVPISMGVGSSLDYLAGRLKRAPRLIQRLGLEWTYRLVQEPGHLWRRYLLEDPPFFYHVAKQRLFGRQWTAKADVEVANEDVSGP